MENESENSWLLRLTINFATLFIATQMRIPDVNGFCMRKNLPFLVYQYRRLIFRIKRPYLEKYSHDNQCMKGHNSWTNISVAVCFISNLNQLLIWTCLKLLSPKWVKMILLLASQCYLRFKNKSQMLINQNR